MVPVFPFNAHPAALIEAATERFLITPVLSAVNILSELLPDCNPSSLKGLVAITCSLLDGTTVPIPTFCEVNFKTEIKKRKKHNNIMRKTNKNLVSPIRFIDMREINMDIVNF